MKLTQEQSDIINSTGNIKINAVAGSGKTTTVIEYAGTRPRNARILYLAFNKTVKEEAQRKFTEKGLHNVQVETAHSLAFRNIVRTFNYTVRKTSYKTQEIAELLALSDDGEKHGEYIVANHINKFISYFCNSDKKKVQELNYLDVIFDEKVKASVSKLYPYIEKQTRILLAKMDRGEIEITHDFYLKKFQLTEPTLDFDYILFDEAQDASAAMLDVFLKQRATKVIVGDTHQQIYGWRHAVNSLEKASFKTYYLSTSFRFSQHIADLATTVLDWKSQLADHESIPIKGEGSSKETKTKAVIARTNLNLLLKAIEYITENKKVKRIYFEGNINSYTYAEDGASLYDVLNLHNGSLGFIRDKLIRSMRNLRELEGYIEKAGDAQLHTMVEIVKEYGDQIPRIMKEIKDKHTDEKDKAEIVFSTVHKCKGMEYDSIQLVNDFIKEEDLEKRKADAKGKNPISKTIEDINLLYVAVTRTKNTVRIPGELLPKGFPKSPYIFVENSPSTTSLIEAKPAKSASPSMSRIRQTHNAAYEPWTAEMDIELTDMYYNGTSVKEMAEYFDRTRGAIYARIKKLELEEEYD